VGFVKTEEAAKRLAQAYKHYFENTKTIVVKTQFGLADAVRDPLRRMVVKENTKLPAILSPLESG
jgi:putative cell wall-binding protein